MVDEVLRRIGLVDAGDLFVPRHVVASASRGFTALMPLTMGHHVVSHHVRAFAAWVEVDCGGAFRDEGEAVVADCLEVVSFGFAHELSERNARSEGAGVAEDGHRSLLMRPRG
jgi:hypothetical protein